MAGRDELPEVRTAHSGLLADGAAPAGVREIVADSWMRSVAAGVNADASAPPITLDQDLLSDYRAEHPLSQIYPLLYDVLGRAAEDCDSVMAVADARGQLLWVCGRTSVLRQAEGIGFVEGAQWDEAHAGTNAPGTALRLDTAVSIRSAEHFVRPVQRWSCAAAPIHDPRTHEILGIVDITGGPDVGTPQTIAMIRAAARMAESELGRLDAVRTSQSGAATGPAPAGAGAARAPGPGRRWARSSWRDWAGRTASRPSATAPSGSAPGTPRSRSSWPGAATGCPATSWPCSSTPTTSPPARRAPSWSGCGRSSARTSSPPGPTA
jgi:hypothetical protein